MICMRPPLGESNDGNVRGVWANVYLPLYVRNSSDRLVALATQLPKAIDMEARFLCWSVHKANE